jgi:hypothetical protein
VYVKDYIKIGDLKDGYLYKIIARNASYGIWIAENQSFAISRIKFGDNFIFEEYHYDCEAFATAQPIEEVEKSPFIQADVEQDPDNKFNYKKEKDILEYLNKYEADRNWQYPKLKGS